MGRRGRSWNPDLITSPCHLLWGIWGALCPPKRHAEVLTTSTLERRHIWKQARCRVTSEDEITQGRVGPKSNGSGVPRRRDTWRGGSGPCDTEAEMGVQDPTHCQRVEAERGKDLSQQARSSSTHFEVSGTLRRKWGLGCWCAAPTCPLVAQEAAAALPTSGLPAGPASGALLGCTAAQLGAGTGPCVHATSKQPSAGLTCWWLIWLLCQSDITSRYSKQLHRLVKALNATELFI